MKTNWKKVLKIVFICLLVAFAIYVLVSFIVNKDGTMYWINYVIDLLNKPLPIVGVTTLALLVFVWKVVITSNYGKAKLKEYDLKREQLEQEHKEFVNGANEKIKELVNENQELRNELVKVCALSTNKKINEFGKVLENYGKENETTNSDTTKE